MKTSSEYLKEANAVVKRIDVESGIERHRSGNAVLIDVRDSAEIASTGTIAGSLQIPRGFIEFVADASALFHIKLFQRTKKLLLSAVEVRWLNSKGKL